jgi:hypothetical protein
MIIRPASCPNLKMIGCFLFHKNINLYLCRPFIPPMVGGVVTSCRRKMKPGSFSRTIFQNVKKAL